MGISILIALLSAVAYSLPGVWFNQGSQLGTASGYEVKLWGCRRPYYGAKDINGPHETTLSTTCEASGIQAGWNNYEWEGGNSVFADETCRLKWEGNTLKGMVCWTDQDDKCEYTWNRAGSNVEQKCYALKGCEYFNYGFNGRCLDTCTIDVHHRPGSNPEQQCFANAGCSYDSRSNHCEAQNSRFIGVKKCHNTNGWYDSDGPYYSCDWYHADAESRCFSYGHKYRNFGKTADEACCACRFGVAGSWRRRELEGNDGQKPQRGNKKDLILENGMVTDEEETPKTGFVFTGGVLNGIERKIIKRGDILVTTMIDSEILDHVSEDVCHKVNWWGADNEMTCPEGESIGTLFQSGLNDANQAEYSLEKGYCCATPVTRECVWKEVDKHELGTIVCDPDFVLTGFRLPADRLAFEDISAMKCCRLD